MTIGAIDGRPVSWGSFQGSERWLVIVLCAAAAVLLTLIQPDRRAVVHGATVAATGFKIVGNDMAPKGVAEAVEGSVWLSGRYETAADRPAGPLALSMSGLFSADVYWNGEWIGSKGRPGTDRESEVPGSIDASVVVPERLLLPTGNRWALRISSHHSGYRAPSAVHKLEIGPYRGSNRQLLYYLPALLTAGGILGCLFVAVGRAIAAKRPVGPWNAASSAFLLAALASETSRAVLNYSYDWHVVRQFATLAMLTGHCACLVAVETRRVGRDSFHHLRSLLTAAAALGLLGILFGSGFDRKMEFMVGAAYIALAGSVLLSRMGARERNLMLLILGAAMLLLVIRQADFLDAGVYGFGVALIASNLVRASRFSPNKAAGSEKGREKLLLTFRGLEQLIDWHEIYSIRADANDCEVILRGGHSLSDNRGLGKLLEHAPDEFLRIHKSFAVNLRRVRAVERVSRGSYRLILEDGSKVPLSRSLREVVRRTLAEEAGFCAELSGGN